MRSAKGSQKCASYDLLEKHFYSNLGEKYTSNLDDNVICRFTQNSFHQSVTYALDCAIKTEGQLLC